MAKIIIHNDDNTFEMSDYTHYTIWKVEAIQAKWRDGYYFKAYCIECNNKQNSITLSIYNRNSINPFVKTNIELFQNTTII